MGNRQVKPYERKPRVCEWDRPRLLALIDFFEKIPGGELQLPIPDLIEATGIPSSALKTHLQWARRYGIIEIEHDWEFGKGRAPNRYKLVIPRARWDEEGQAIVARYQAEQKAVPWGVGGVKGGSAQRLAPPGQVGSAWLDVR